ncbi:MAG: hypothetical protein ABID09_04165 [Candidatus Omnitrophota bacterium]
MKEYDRRSKARLIAMISRSEMDFIDRVGKDALFSTGKKLSRTDVITAIIDAIAELPITGRDIRTRKELRARIDKAIEERLQKGVN